VRDAALNCKSQIIKMAAGELEVPAEDLVLENGEVRSTVDPDKSIAVGQVRAFRASQVVVGVGYRGPNPEDTVTCPFAAQFCEVEVNTLTGEVKVLRFLGAHESGRVMNRMTYDNQIYGGITMGIGLGMTERRILDSNQTGKMVNRNFHDYKIPTALDVPADISTVAIDLGDTFNTTGAKGIGEPVTIPTAAAVANAVYNAVGVRITDTPINPTTLAAKLAAKREGRG
jgi:xanthine dehydrogenase YagR molybdenum-binding subunit